MSKVWAHDELASDLAAHLASPERMTWQDMQLGSMHSQRPDVYALWKSYGKPNPTAYECKISRSDFRADVTSGKWRGYLNFAWSVVFAVPNGLVAKTEVPDMCGLIVRHETCWRLAKRPTIQPRPLSQEALLKLVIDGVHREGPRWRSKNYTDGQQKFAKRFGAEAARYVSDAASTHSKIAYAERQAKTIIELAEQRAKDSRNRIAEDLPPQWRELLNILDLPDNSQPFQIRNAIHQLRQQTEGSEEKRALRDMVASMKRHISLTEHLLQEKTEAVA